MAGCAARAPPGSEARLSLAAFLLGASVLALPLLTRAGLQGRTALALYVAGLNALLLLLYRPPRYQVRAGAGGRDARHPPGGRAVGAAAGSGAQERGSFPGALRGRSHPVAAGTAPRRAQGRGAGPSTRRGGCRIAVGAVQQLRQMRVGRAVSELPSPFT